MTATCKQASRQSERGAGVWGILIGFSAHLGSGCLTKRDAADARHRDSAYAPSRPPPRALLSASASIIARVSGRRMMMLMSDVPKVHALADAVGLTCEPRMCTVAVNNSTGCTAISKLIYPYKATIVENAFAPIRTFNVALILCRCPNLSHRIMYPTKMKDHLASSRRISLISV